MRTLDASDLEYHKFVIRQSQDAQAVMKSWGRHMSEKYTLSATDTITEDGHIRSASTLKAVEHAG